MVRVYRGRIIQESVKEGMKCSSMYETSPKPLKSCSRGYETYTKDSGGVPEERDLPTPASHLNISEGLRIQREREIELNIFFGRAHLC